jgi:hypothetical protein
VQNKNGFRKLVRQEIPKLTKSGFFGASKRLAPSLEMQHLLPCEKVGIRAQLYNIKKGELEMDFYVEQGENATHILNAVSPAFTCSQSFANHVVETYLD